MITLPSAKLKNRFIDFILNTDDLLSLLTNINVRPWQSFFLNKANWKRVIATYISEGGQYFSVSFPINAALVNSTGKTFVSDKSRNYFTLESLTIYDHQNGRRRIDRREIPSVEQYDMLFESSEFKTAMVSFVEHGQYALHADVNNKDLIYITSNNKGYTGNPLYYFPYIDVENNGEIDSTRSQMMSDPRILTYCFDTENDCAYVIGKFNDRFGSNVITASSNPDNFRLLKVDFEEESIEEIAELTVSDINVSQSSRLEKTGDKLLVLNSSKVSCFSLTTKEVLWSKATSGFDSHMSAAVNNNRLFFRSSTWNGQYVDDNNRTVIFQVSLEDGSVIKRLPYDSGLNHDMIFVTPNGQYLYGAGNYISRFDLTSLDEEESWEKVYNSSVSNYFLDGNDDCVVFIYSSEIKIANPDFTQVSTLAGTGIGRIHGVVSGNYLALNVDGIIKFYDLTTKALAPDHHILYTDVRYASVGITNLKSYGNAIGVRVPQGFGYSGTGIDFASYPSAQNSTLMVFNRATQEVLMKKYIPNIYSSSNGYLAKVFTHYLMPNKVIIIKSSNQLRTLDSLTLNELGDVWPDFTGTSIRSYKLIDNYLYLYVGYNSNVSDVDGTFNSNGLLRIDIITKKIDRTFNPDLSVDGYISTPPHISSSNEYIYVHIVHSGHKIYRISKTTGVVTNVTSEFEALTDNGMSGAASYNIADIGNGKILVYVNPMFGYGSGKLDDKIYMIVNESSLTPTGVQPDDTNDDLQYISFNPFDKCLYGYLGNSDTPQKNRDLVKIDTSTHQVVRIYGSSTGLYNLPNSFRHGTGSYDTYSDMVFTEANELITVLNGFVGNNFLYGLVAFNPFPALA